jgi:hypothetical protein
VGHSNRDEVLTELNDCDFKSEEEALSTPLAAGGLPQLHASHIRNTTVSTALHSPSSQDDAKDHRRCISSSSSHGHAHLAPHHHLHASSVSKHLNSRDDASAATLSSTSPTSLVSSVVAAAGCVRSESDTSLPSVLATAPQSPPAPPRRRMSNLAAMAPCGPASPSVPRSSSSSSGGGAAGSGPFAQTSGAAHKGTSFSVTATTSAPAADKAGSRFVYPGYNVHPVLPRTIHPFFQRDVACKVGRHIISGSGGANSTSARNLFPLCVPQGKWNAAASTSMWSSQASVAAAAMSARAMDVFSQPGYRFSQSTAGPLLRCRNTGEVVVRSGSDAASFNHHEPLELLSTTHSTEEKNPLSSEQPQPHLTNPPDILKTCPSPALADDADVVARSPSRQLPSPVASREEGSWAMLQSSSTSGGLYLQHPSTFNASFSSSFSRAQEMPCLTNANTWTTAQHSPSRPGRRISLTSLRFSQSSTSLSSSSQGTAAATKSPRSAQRASVLQLAVSSFVTGTSSSQTCLRAYSRRNLRRGRWRLSIAREECEARTALEEAEAYEAIRILPASCQVWASYIDTAFSEDNDALGHYPLAPATKAEEAAAAVLKGREDNHAEGHLDGGDVIAIDDDSTTTTSSDGGHRHVMENLQRQHVLRRARTADDSATQHPAFLAAALRLVLLEEICRAHIVETADQEFQEGICRPYTYAHRIMTVGTLPLERFLRRWVGVFRARNELHARQRTRLCDAERVARASLFSSSRSLAARQHCMMAAIEAEEKYYRTQLELLHVQDAAWSGVVLLRLQERVELFSLLYGSTMRQTWVCGRVQGTTLFRSLVLKEEAMRHAIEREAEAAWRGIHITQQLRWIAVTAEPHARTQLLQAECAQRLELTRMIYTLTVHYTMRDVEMQEYDARQSWGNLWKQTKVGDDIKVAVEEL